MRALPGNAMSEQIASFAGARSDDAVAIRICAACPEDASFGGCHPDVALEPDCERDRLPRGATRLGAELSASVLDVAGVDLEIFPALRTHAMDHHAFWSAHAGMMHGRQQWH